MTAAGLALLWFGILGVGFVYAGFPLLLWILSRFVSFRPKSDPNYTPKLSVLIVAHNEQDKIVAKIDNVLALDWPADKLEVIVCSDGSTDRTNELVRAYGDERVKLAAIEKNVGVNEAFAHGVRLATGEVYLFTDTGGKFEHDGLRLVVQHLADPRVGAASGRCIFTNPKKSNVGAGYRGYWIVETGMRQLLSRLGLATVLVGAYEAIRKELYLPVPSQFSNDLAIPMHVRARGYKLVFEPRARLITPQMKSPLEEFSRRVRTVVRAFSSLGYIRSVAPIHKNLTQWLALICHKYLRWLTWVFMLAALIGNILLAGRSPAYTVLLALQLAFYLMAGIGLILDQVGRPVRWLAGPFYFCLLQAACLVGFVKALCGVRVATWKPVE